MDPKQLEQFVNQYYQAVHNADARPDLKLHRDSLDTHPIRVLQRRPLEWHCARCDQTRDRPAQTTIAYTARGRRQRCVTCDWVFEAPPEPAPPVRGRPKKRQSPQQTHEPIADNESVLHESTQQPAPTWDQCPNRIDHHDTTDLVEDCAHAAESDHETAQPNLDQLQIQFQSPRA
jgi:hypothetical protein